MLLLIARAVTGFQDVGAAYSIGVGGVAVETNCVTCIYDALPMADSSTHTPTFAIGSLPSVPTPTSSSSASPGHPSPEQVSYMPPAPSTHSSQVSSQLSIPVKAGIIGASIIVFFLMLLLILEYTYLRRKRQDRTLHRAIEEVERGTELRDSTANESKENMVLESRVEIVVEGEEHGSVRDSSDGESQWGAGTEEGNGDDDLSEWGRGGRWERGRNAMSLSRTESRV